MQVLGPQDNGDAPFRQTLANASICPRKVLLTLALHDLPAADPEHRRSRSIVHAGYGPLHQASEGRSPAERTSSQALGRVRAALVANAISATALVGPAVWIAWNHFTRGDAFDFVARVTAYRRALGEGTDESILARLIAYPIALAKELPEIAIPFAAALLLAAVPRLRPTIVARLRRHAAPLSLAAVQVVALAAALVKDGAPTHHPERAVLFPALAMAVFVADVAVGLAPKLPRALAYVAGAALFVRAAAIPLAGRASFAQRESEVAMGQVVANKTRPEAKILIEVTDYGYFAILASSGRPESFELDRDLDPRHPIVPPVFDDDADHIAWLRERGVDYLIGPRDESAPVELRFEGTITYPTKRHRISQVPRE